MASWNILQLQLWDVTVVFILKCYCSVVLHRRVNRPPFMASQSMEATLGGRMRLLKV
jgi:hypothetical protein